MAGFGRGPALQETYVVANGTYKTVFPFNLGRNPLRYGTRKEVPIEIKPA